MGRSSSLRAQEVRRSVCPCPLPEVLPINGVVEQWKYIACFVRKETMIHIATVSDTLDSRKEPLPRQNGADRSHTRGSGCTGENRHTESSPNTPSAGRQSAPSACSILSLPHSHLPMPSTAHLPKRTVPISTF